MGNHLRPGAALCALRHPGRDHFRAWDARWERRWPSPWSSGIVADISASLFNPAYTMPSLLANEFAEATDNLHYASLVEVALVLVVITIIINAIARLLIWSVSAG